MARGQRISSDRWMAQRASGQGQVDQGLPDREGVDDRLPPAAHPRDLGLQQDPREWGRAGEDWQPSATASSVQVEYRRFGSFSNPLRMACSTASGMSGSRLRGAGGGVE